jgi:quercetin dioxygenase-like cupin family protein
VTSHKRQTNQFICGRIEFVSARRRIQIAATITPKHSRDPNPRRRILAMKRENPTIEICPGMTRRTVAHGNTMYQMLATLAAGSRMPAHSHPQEQIVHILEGKMRLIVEGVPHELSAGDSFYLASNVSHGVETLSATRVLDTFSPPRADYLAADEKVLHGAL